MDGKLLYANNKGFYVLNGSGEQLNHTPLSSIGVTGIFYRLRLDDKYISITVDGRIETQTALTVLDRKSYKTLYSLPYPLKAGEQSKIYFDDILFTQNSFYTVYDNQLIPLK
ncbi:hypothetical protein D3C80_1613250 [compost metagenome]